MCRLVDRVKTSKPFRIVDFAIYAIVVVAAVCLLLFALQPAGAVAKVYSRGVLVCELSLDSDSEFVVDNGLGICRVVVSEGEVFVAEADCRDHICVNLGKQSKVGSRIVCIPNEVIVVVDGATDVEATT